MTISRRCVVVIVGCVILANVALGQVQAPSETSQDPQPPQTTPPVEKSPTLPKMQVVAPPKKKDVPPPQTAPSAEKAPVLPKIEVVAPKQKAPRPPPAPPKALPAPAAVPLVAATPPPSPPAWAGAFEVRMSPVGGSELPVDKVPAGISVVTSPQIERLHSNSVTETINTYVPGATINEALGNGLAADLQYRGFSASPLNGTPQGLAIYQNGVRINEVFGDTMNWDLIPQIAIADIVMMSNNPVYGLNALGARSMSS